MVDTFPRLSSAAILLLLVFFIPLACGGEQEREQKVVGSRNDDTSKLDNQEELNSKDDRGDFKLGTFSTSYSENNPYYGWENYVYISEDFTKSIFEDVVKFLNSYLKLNKDITIHGVDCEVVNAFYDPENYRIIMCNEILLDIYAYTLQYIEDNQEATILSALAYIGIFGHELGHALINNYDLPVLGKEEDAADAISVVLLIETSETAEERRAMVAGIIWLGIYLNSSGSGVWYGEHSIGPVRLANLICWAGGAEPDALQGIIKEIYDSMVESGRDCAAEYAQQYNSVKKLLKPYLKGEL